MCKTLQIWYSKDSNTKKKSKKIILFPSELFTIFHEFRRKRLAFVSTSCYLSTLYL